MAITLHSPIGFSYIGGRNYNDDSIFPFPKQASVEDKIFLVCDGVGGNATGYVASKLACEKVKEYINLYSEETLCYTFFQNALLFAYREFVDFEQENPLSKGMATTLTLVYVRESTIWLVHLGDSRIYHFRNGQIVHKTKDHSFVADLTAAGLISEEEARNHPQKNIISRAIQTESPEKIEPDVYCVTEVCADDCFFLCTDGVLESVTDVQLSTIFGNDATTLSVKMQEIFRLCAAHSKDNFSCYLVPIKTGSIDYIPTQSVEIIDTAAFMGIIDSEEVEY